MIFERHIWMELLLVAALALSASATRAGDALPESPRDRSGFDPALQQKASDWVRALGLGDAEKASRVSKAIATHLEAVRDWHDSHPYTSVPAGINPATGKALSQLDREIISDSCLPKSVHDDLLAALKRDLTEAQVETVLDKYTVGKVDFTLSAYRAIVPDLKPEEEATILGNLKQAREQAIDYKNMKEISAIFEIYKTKCEQYLNSNGRNWKELYKAYTIAAKAKKAASSHEADK